MDIRPGDLDDPRVIALLRLHVDAARAQTARGSDHALDVDGLRATEIRFFTGWIEGTLAAVGAWRVLAAGHGELKSMHTAAALRRRGAGRAMLDHLVASAQAAGVRRLSLETGSWDYFAPARAFYRRAGFVECGPFGTYRADPNSVFMTRPLEMPDASERSAVAPGTEAGTRRR